MQGDFEKNNYLRLQVLKKSRIHSFIMPNLRFLLGPYAGYCCKLPRWMWTTCISRGGGSQQHVKLERINCGFVKNWSDWLKRHSVKKTLPYLSGVSVAAAKVRWVLSPEAGNWKQWKWCTVKIRNLMQNIWARKLQAQSFFQTLSWTIPSRNTNFRLRNWMWNF